MTVLYQKGAANCVPEASVRRGPQTLSGFIGRKGSCRRPAKFRFKDYGLTIGKDEKLAGLSFL
ncbi:hypothetical protein A2774_01240 [Candidatus Roizmanbacteria bacterium RIFCSPHIGHO2_01_FULL_39_12c]|uniref:Uncharacterized protein n=1 Tax=Candidatus Roizmanbacteria bacterium RIFCSPHIGHO2_01_FULL_39_12c TaxID=1802031 RepID=A0A1F7GDU5_9BACT|nr:MAG: hypothetical protein A2774_01240 [Candidatus Roizmanbacteria bacterium RIFCSPHIGHO2_01_FULL_39_12c]